jgi:hypothetical protein
MTLAVVLVSIALEQLIFDRARESGMGRTTPNDLIGISDVGGYPKRITGSASRCADSERVRHRYPPPKGALAVQTDTEFGLIREINQWFFEHYLLTWQSIGNSESRNPKEILGY